MIVAEWGEGIERALLRGQFALKRRDRELCSRTDATFAEHIPDVKAHCVFTDPHLPRDFPIGAGCQDQIQEFLLTPREPRAWKRNYSHHF